MLESLFVVGLGTKSNLTSRSATEVRVISRPVSVLEEPLWLSLGRLRGEFGCVLGLQPIAVAEVRESLGTGLSTRSFEVLSQSGLSTTEQQAKGRESVRNKDQEVRGRRRIGQYGSDEQ